MTHELLVDPTALREQVRDKYREVALEPNRTYHFHTGRPLAARLGYNTTLACFSNFGIFAGIDTIAISAKPGQAPTLFVAGPDGTINKIDQTTTPPTVTAVVTGGTRTDGMIVGPDRCLYATQSTSIEKLTNSDGSCSFVPVRFPGQGLIG